MMQYLENLSIDDLGTGKLPLVEPMEWKNVSIHLQSSIKILKEQQMTQISNVYNLKLFLDRFSKKVLSFIATNDNEI